MHGKLKGILTIVSATIHLLTGLFLFFVFLITHSVYPDVNVHRPRDYWDYEALTVNWGDQEEYEVIRKIGRGKYSEVGSAVLLVHGENF